MNITNIYRLPIAANVCNQMLREVVRTPAWTMAHVVMNPETESLLHVHRKMTEVYVVTMGKAELVVGTNVSLKVSVGNVVVIPAGISHKTLNTGLGTFQHFVLANPPFDPADVHLLEDRKIVPDSSRPDCTLPPFVDCFDGARIIAYNFPDFAVSHAFGFVMSDPKRRKPPHYHKKTTEYIFVVEGEGEIEIDNHLYPVGPGDWIEVSAGESHALRNPNDQHMVVLCTCHPAFDEGDVYWEK